MRVRPAERSCDTDYTQTQEWVAIQDFLPERLRCLGLRIPNEEHWQWNGHTRLADHLTYTYSDWIACVEDLVEAEAARDRRPSFCSAPASAACSPTTLQPAPHGSAA